ncbi:MAG: hypothetical protein N2689_00835 [Verrucomicrobiae bacterium]|nr:hypothetical protein [Verrucomicrobiae bacterium]
MNTRHSLALMAYAGLLIILAAVPSYIEPETTARAFGFCCVAGFFCLLWGTLGLFGFRRRIGAGLTLGAIGFVLLTQAVTRWMPSAGGQPSSLLLTVLITLLFFVTVGLLAWILPREDFTSRNTTGAPPKREIGAATRKAA